MKIFISYAREDAEIALKINNDLNIKGLTTWLDINELLPGQNWKLAIKQEINNCSHFLTLLSTNSNKRGFLQSEIKYAFEVLDEIPDNDIFIIPVRINKCTIIERFKDIHVIDLFPSYENCIEKIISAIYSTKSNSNISDKNNSDISDESKSNFTKQHSNKIGKWIIYNNMG